jgi:hypothetical protein
MRDPPSRMSSESVDVQRRRPADDDPIRRGYEPCRGHRAAIPTTVRYRPDVGLRDCFRMTEPRFCDQCGLSLVEGQANQ